MSNLHKRQVYAGLMEIINDDKYYYYSKVGNNYCHLTDMGKAALVDYMNQVAPTMRKKNEEHLIELAKSIAWDELKK